MNQVQHVDREHLLSFLLFRPAVTPPEVDR
jgi:hypothetical protein